ncbi:MAG: T9SS type A sorting domain-containing protein [Breznakibacter sp.]
MNRISIIFFLLIWGTCSLAAQTVVKIPFQQSALFEVQPQEVYKSFEHNAPMELGLEAEIHGGSGVYSFSWTLNGVQIGAAPTLTVTEKGTYTLTVTDGAGCTSSVAYHIDLQLGVKEAGEPLLSIYPNPSDGLSYLQSPELQDLKRVEIYGMDGRFWFSCPVPGAGSRFEISTSQLATGRYLVVAYFGSKKITKVLVVK